jgi:hypothetical protein
MEWNVILFWKNDDDYHKESRLSVTAMIRCMDYFVSKQEDRFLFLIVTVPKFVPMYRYLYIILIGF